MGPQRSESSHFDYESRRHPLLPWPLFLRRAAAHFFVTFGAVVVVDAVGTLGYHAIGGLAWVDAFLNASMILAAMGPVDRMETTAGKVFSALYALFCGVFFIVTVGFVLAPWAHRLLHKLHFADEDVTNASGREST